MSHVSVSHIFHLSVGGGDFHRYATLLAAEIAASKGYNVGNMAQWTVSPERPDLVISKREKFIDGAHRSHGTITYWLDIVVSHDPRRTWESKGLACDDVLIVDLSALNYKKVKLSELVNRIAERIP